MWGFVSGADVCAHAHIAGSRERRAMLGQAKESWTEPYTAKTLHARSRHLGALQRCRLQPSWATCVHACMRNGKAMQVIIISQQAGSGER